MSDVAEGTRAASASSAASLPRKRRNSPSPRRSLGTHGTVRRDLQGAPVVCEEDRLRGRNTVLRVSVPLQTRPPHPPNPAYSRMVLLTASKPRHAAFVSCISPPHCGQYGSPLATIESYDLIA